LPILAIATQLRSKRTIHAALDHGVTVFDTANVYGAGHSERILGDALKGREDVLLVSKLGMAFDEETKQVSGHDANPENVLPAIEASLNRLNREQIDIMLLHINALPIEDAKPIFEEMEKARAQGKIGAFGWSTDFPDSAKAMAEMDGFIGIENAMNVFVDVPKLQKTIADHNLISFVRSPLAMGVLTGKYGENSTIPEDSVLAHGKIEPQPPDPRCQECRTNHRKRRRDGTWSFALKHHGRNRKPDPARTRGPATGEVVNKECAKSTPLSASQKLIETHQE